MLCLLGLCSWAQLLIFARQLQSLWLKKVRLCESFLDLFYIFLKVKSGLSEQLELLNHDCA